MATLTFAEKESKKLQAIVVSFDLCGFSTFCKQPDASQLVPQLISRLFVALNGFFLQGLGDAVFSENGIRGNKIRQPDYCKFTGDGALMFWLAENVSEFKDAFCQNLVCAMKRFQIEYPNLARRLEHEWKVHSLPNRMRMGITNGVVYTLELGDGTEDYAGYCVNLAVRLQDHCPDLGVLILSTVCPGLEGTKKYYARGMKGAYEEPIMVFDDQLRLVDPKILKEKFSEPPIRAVATNRLKSKRIAQNSNIQSIEEIAASLLARCVEIAKVSWNVGEAIHNLREFQKSFSPNSVQISLVLNDVLVLHADPKQEKRQILDGWKDVDGHALYSFMKSQRAGTKTIRINGFPNRLTAIAFAHVLERHCIVVVEAHQPV